MTISEAKLQRLFKQAARREDQRKLAMLAATIWHYTGIFPNPPRHVSVPRWRGMVRHVKNNGGKLS